jgi:hypothetical protein
MDRNTLIAAGVGFALYLMIEQGAFKLPGRATPSVTPASPAGDSAKQSGTRSSLRSRFRASAVPIVGGFKTRQDAVAGQYLVYHSLRIDYADNFQVYLNLRAKNDPTRKVAHTVKLSNPPPPYIRAKVAQAIIENAEGSISEKAKCEGAKRLNAEVLSQTGVDPGITCDDSVSEAVNKAATIAGAAGGAAACTATGVGATVAPLCGIAGSYLGAYIGDKIGPWLEDAWDDVGEWLDGAWDTINPF